MYNKQTITTIVVVVGVGALSFFGGLKYAEMKSQSQVNNPYAGRMMQRSGAGNAAGTGRQDAMMRNGMRPVFGEVLSIDESTMTVKMDDGTSKIVVISDKTTASKQTEVKMEEIKTGEKVSVIGSANADGTVTASSIQVNPVMRNFPSIQPVK